MRKMRKIIVIVGKKKLVVALTALMIAATVMPLMILGVHENFCLKIVVMDNGKMVPSLIYLMVFYPDGFRFIAAERALEGVAIFWIPVEPLRRAWENERNLHGRFALPAFAITVFTNTSKADFKVVTLKWKEFKPAVLGGFKEIVIKPRHLMKKKLVIKPASSSFSRMDTLGAISLLVSILQPYPPYKPGTYAVLEDYYEKAGRVALMKLKTDPYSEGNIHVTYRAGHTVYVSVDFFLFSVGTWDIGDYVGLSSTDEGSAGTFIPKDTSGYVSISATYRWEYWVYYDDITGEKVDECYLIYWCNFDPKSLSSQAGVEAEVSYEIVKSDVEGKGLPSESETPVPSMYSYGSTSESGFSVKCVDSGWFIAALETAGKITNPAAILLSLVVNVSVKTSSYQGFIMTADIYGKEGMYFNIEKGESDWGGYPAVYFKVYRTG